MCLWATSDRVAAIKLSIWSADELPVLGLRDGESYFVRRERESRAEAGYAAIDGFGLRAFQSGFAAGEGTVVVLKNGRVAEFEFAGVDARDARSFVRLVMERF